MTIFGKNVHDNATSPVCLIFFVNWKTKNDLISLLSLLTIRYDTIAEFNVDSKAEYTA